MSMQYVPTRYYTLARGESEFGHPVHVRILSVMYKVNNLDTQFLCTLCVVLTFSL